MGVRAILPRPEGRGLTRIPINNQHTTAVCGEGLPTLAALRKIAEDLQLAQWQETVREVHEAVLTSWVGTRWRVSSYISAARRRISWVLKPVRAQVNTTGA